MTGAYHMIEVWPLAAALGAAIHDAHVAGNPLRRRDGRRSAPLLGDLCQHAVTPQLTCQFHGRQGSVAFRDDRVTWHCAINDDHDQRHLMHRITVEGSPLN